MNKNTSIVVSEETAADFVPQTVWENTVPVKKGTINPETGKPWTSKSKPAMGLTSDREIVWAAAHFSLEDHNTLLAFCKSRDMEAQKLCGLVVMAWFDMNRSMIEAGAADHQVGEKTVSDMEKEMEAALRKIERMKALILNRQTANMTYAEMDDEMSGDDSNDSAE